MTRHLDRIVCSLAALSCSVTAAHAQQPPAQAGLSGEAQAHTDSTGDGINEIVVTARRIAENEQRVPITIQAFSGERLRETSASSPQDLTQNVPGVFLSGGGAPVNALYSIRGESKPQLSPDPNNAGVVTYFNEVPLTTYLSSLPQFDMNSIEVLKGPQGTLFGRNTTGGAVLLTSVQPSFDVGGYLQVTSGNYSYQSVEGAFNLPIIADKVALRVAGRLDRADGYVKNQSGPDEVNQHVNSLRASLLIKPTDWLTNTTIWDRTWVPFGAQQNGGIIAVGSNLAAEIPSLAQQIAAQQALGPRVNNNTDSNSTGWTATGVSNKTVADVNANLSIVNIFGYRSTRYQTSLDFSGLPADWFNDAQKLNLDQYSDELQFRVNTLNDTLQLLAGGFYLDTKPSGPNGGLNTLQDLFQAFGDGPPSFTGNPASGLAAPFQYQFYTETSKAVFANVNYQLSALLAGLSVDGGVRYTWDQYSACSGSQNAPQLPSGYENIDPRVYTLGPDQCNSKDMLGYSQVSGSSAAPSWQVGANWQVDDQTLVYTTVRHGYRAGGLNTPALVGGLAPYQTYAPEKVTDEEIGLKASGRLEDWGLRLNIAGFHSRKENDQLTGVSIAIAPPYCVPPDFRPFIDGNCNPLDAPTQSVMVINGGTTDLLGMEGELTVAPTPRLQVTIGGSTLRADLHQTVPAQLAPYFAVDVLPFTPRSTAMGNIRYSVPLGGMGDLVFNADYYWSDQISFYAYTAPSYSVVNLRLDWNDIGGRPMDLSFYVKNLADKEYVSAPALTAIPAPVTSVLYGPPRQFGAQLRYRFGGQK